MKTKSPAATPRRSSSDLSAPRSLVIRASAGTGKTFQLTNCLLRLLLSGTSPRAILATTFTRKAAGEILNRVIERLAKATASEIETKKLAGELGVAIASARKGRRAPRRDSCVKSINFASRRSTAIFNRRPSRSPSNLVSLSAGTCSKRARLPSFKATLSAAYFARALRRKSLT